MAVLLFGALWSLFLLFLYIKIPSFLSKNNTHEVRAGWLLVLSIALGSRLLPNLVLSTGAGYDIQSYKIVGNLILQGDDVYTSSITENRHPYLPLQMYWMALSSHVSERFHLPFEKTVRLAPILEDAAIALALYFVLLRTLSPKLALLGGLLYAVNPISTFVSAYHGQFDALPALFTLLTLYWFGRNTFISGCWLGLGILAKSWPVLALPPLLIKIQSWKKRMFFTAVIATILGIGVGLYLIFLKANPQVILNRVLSYNRGIGVWGYTTFFRILAILQPKLSLLYDWIVQYGRWITLAGLCLVWLWMNSRRKLPQEVFLTVLVSFLAFTHAFAIQYLAWIVPFAIFCQEYRWLNRFILAAFVYMFLTYNTLILEVHITNLLPLPQADWIIISAGFPAWLVCVAWTKKLLANRWETDEATR